MGTKVYSHIAFQHSNKILRHDSMSLCIQWDLYGWQMYSLCKHCWLYGNKCISYFTQECKKGIATSLQPLIY